MEIDSKIYLVSGGSDNLVNIWDVDTGKIVNSIRVDTCYKIFVNSLCTITINNKTFIVCGCTDSNIKIIDPGSGFLIYNLKGHKSYVNCLSTIDISFRGKKQKAFLSGSTDNFIRLWI